MIDLDKNLYEKLLNLSSEAMILINKQGFIEYANNACFELFGFSKEEIIEKPFLDFLQPEYQTTFRKQFQESFTDQSTTFSKNHFIIKAKGEKCHIHSRNDFIYDDKKKVAMISVLEDISNKNRIKQELQINDERYQKAQKLGNVGNWEYHIQTEEFWGSDQAKRIYGIDPETDFFTTEEVESCIIERERVHQALVDLIENNKPYQLEFEIITKDTGKTRVIVSQAMLEYDDQGTPSKITGVVHDVTDQKEAEKKLVKQQYYLTKAQELGKIGTWELHLENSNLTWTNMAYRIFGIPEGTPMSYEKFLSCVHPDDIEYVDTKWKAALQKKPYNIEHRIVVNGEIKWVREKANIEFNEHGQPTSAIGFIQDISDRKFTELKLAEKEERYRILLENIGAGVGYFDLDGNLVLFNKRAAENMGGHPTDFEKKSVFELYGAKLGQLYFNRIKDAYKTDGLTEYIDKVPLLGKNQWYKSVYNKIHDASGSIIGVQVISHDITEMKVTEEALRKSEEHLELIIKGSNEAPWDWDYASNKIYYSPQWWKQIGYLPNELPSDDQLWYKILHPEDRPAVNRQLELAMSSHLESYEIEFRLQHKDGHYVPILSRGIILRDKKNQIVRLAGSNMDLTKLKKAEAEIIEAKEKAERYLDMAGNMFISLNTDGRIVLLNQKALEILEYTKKELMGKLWIKTCIPVEIQDKVEDVFNQVIAGELDSLKNFENEVVSKNGTKKIISWNNSVLKDKKGNIEYLFSSGIDITEVKRAQLELHESQERFNLAMEAAKDGIFDWNLETNQIYYSPAWKSMLGYEYNELPNDFSVWEKLTDAKDVQKSWELQQQVINKKLDRFEVEFKMLHKDGHWVDILSRAEAIFNHQGKAIRLVGTHVDISAMKKVEKELTEAKLKAEESDQLKSAFLANMSHEIRTPMNGIMGFTSLLKEPDLNGKERDKYIEIIQKSGVRMLNTVNDLIDISRIETGQVDLSINELNVDEEIENLFQFFSAEAHDRGLTLKVSNKKLDFRTILQTDQSKFNSILTNLIKNSIKYTRTGTIEFGYEKKDGLLEFFVRDTGIGIPENRQHAIFERFVQADIHDKHVFEGAGLGLSISKAYVELLGGRIWLKSTENKGSTFYFSIPYQPKQLVPNKLSDPIYPANSELNLKRKLKVLIAEDDEVSFMHLSILLEEISENIVHAISGTEAVEICRKQPEIDLVLMDIKMSPLNGYEATRKIREFNEQVIIIAQSAYALEGDREKALIAGCNDYITKPINKEEFIQKINKYTLAQ